MTAPSLPSSPAPVPPSAMAVRLSPLAGAVLALFLAAGLASCLWAMFSGKIDWLPQRPTWSDIRHGEVTHRIAKSLSSVPFAEDAARLERAASWLVIGDTGSRVRQGCPGWLFLSEELVVHPHAEANARARADKVVQLQRQLKARGIDLLVAVVPDKSRIAADSLCGLHRPALFAARAADWVRALQGQGVVALDLAPVLQPLGSGAFLRTDTHWNETGAEAAAKAVAHAILARGVQPSPAQAYDSRIESPTVRPGDLVRLAGLDGLPVSLQPAREVLPRSVIEPKASAAPLGADDLFGDSQLPNVAEIGTSFSRNSNFMPFLQRDLGASVGAFARDGGEFSGAAKEYFASPAFKQTPPRLLVWEITERDLQKPYQDDIRLP